MNNIPVMRGGRDRACSRESPTGREGVAAGADPGREKEKR